MPVNAFLETLRDQTEEIRNTVSSWERLPESTLLSQPEPGSWSPVQCLDHLNGYGDFYLPHLESALSAPTGNAREFHSGWLGNYFANSMEPKPDGRPKSKMKAFARHVPPPQPDAQAVVAEFLRQQARLLELIDRARTADLNARRTPLSIASWLKLKTGDVLRFLVAHNRRHLAQAERALACTAPGFTAR